MRLLGVFLIFGWVGFFSLVTKSEAQTVHAILVAQTLDPNIGIAAAADKSKITSFLANVRSVTSLNVALTVVDGSGFGCAAIVDAVSRLTVSSDDVVFFYYAGSGFRRDSSQLSYPELGCSRPSELAVTFLQVVDLIKLKRARLSVAIADTYNRLVDVTSQTIAPSHSRGDSNQRAALTRLLKEHRGTLIISSALPGEYSGFQSIGPTVGGLFTNQFLLAVDQSIASGGANTTWKEIATEAVKPITVAQYFTFTQNPQYSMEEMLIGPQVAALDPRSALAADVSQDQIDPADLRRFWVEDNTSTTSVAAAPQPAPPPFILTRQHPGEFRGTFGVDLSHYTFDIDPTNPACQTQQGYGTVGCSCTADWQAVQNSGIRFVYTKASDGGATDLSFARVWSDLKSKHESRTVSRGAYHFLRPGIDPEKQAEVFLRAIGAVNGHKPTQLSPVLDIEWSNSKIIPETPEFLACPASRRTKNDKGKYFCDAWYMVSPSTIADMARKWINRVEQATGLPVTIYTNPTAWWNPVMSHHGKELLANNRAVWTSRYTSPGPKFDNRWVGGNSDWKMAPLPEGALYPPYPGKYSIPHFWQFTESGFLAESFLTCSGRSTRKKVDMNFIPVGTDDFPVPLIQVRTR